VTVLDEQGAPVAGFEVTFVMRDDTTSVQTAMDGSAEGPSLVFPDGGVNNFIRASTPALPTEQVTFSRLGVTAPVVVSGGLEEDTVRVAGQLVESGTVVDSTAILTVRRNGETFLHAVSLGSDVGEVSRKTSIASLEVILERLDSAPSTSGSGASIIQEEGLLSGLLLQRISDSGEYLLTNETGRYVALQVSDGAMSHPLLKLGGGVFVHRVALRRR